AVTDSVLLMLDDGWRQGTVLDQGHRVRCQPGLIGSEVNRKLRQYERKLGPDPASIDSCMIGGIAANNASGMCCGTAQNSYQTMSAMSFILADGTQVKSDDLVSVENFKNTHKDLIESLTSLAKQCREDNELVSLIKHKYRLKNTTGFSLNALIDFTDPIEILTHLMIGSEGCLGFISDITYNTVPDYAAKATGLYVFPSLEAACQWVVDYGDMTMHAIELLDDRALASVPETLKGLVKYGRGNAALLIECQAESQQQLAEYTAALDAVLGDDQITSKFQFSQDEATRSKLWKVRKGVVPAIAARRRPNTSVIIEDIAFPREHLAEGIKALRECFTKQHYLDISIIGHARDGNLHFILHHDFSQAHEVQQYQQLMADLGELVIRLEGSLKAEHGTGRNMAPYVAKEWGDKAYQLMHDIKSLIDPRGLLNPGVILNADKTVHIKDLKQLPITHPIIDQCMECGYCESACPSTALSFSPRQRIVLAREIEQLKMLSDTPEHQHQLQHAEQLFDDMAVATCATTSMCQLDCPVAINTGEFILEHMAQNPTITNRALKYLSVFHGLGLYTAKGFLWLRHQLETRGMAVKVPLPTMAPPLVLQAHESNEKAVWFATCTPRTMSSVAGDVPAKHLGEVLNNLMAKANIEMLPVTAANSCCGLAYRSKGLKNAAENKALALIERLEAASEGGKYPIVFDTSSCLVQVLPYLPKHLKCYEACDYVRRFILPQVDLKRQQEPIVLHINCSTKQLGLADSFKQLANACSESVQVPHGIECCGFAGTKGITKPELNAHALRHLKEQVDTDCQKGYSNSITCEVGLTEHSAIPYQSLLYLVDELSSSKAPTPKQTEQQNN
ncbi:MAG: FAD-binding oxidoreductase, partial [Enterobacterales bacterium]|nr:FAD-binding oxidoreductase [Enterobacterales bacterium]